MAPNRQPLDEQAQWAELRQALEEDQLYAAKQQTRLPRRKLSPGLQVLLWSLRVYVVVMLVIVAMAVVKALR